MTGTDPRPEPEHPGRRIPPPPDWRPAAGGAAAVAPPDWEISDPAAPRCRAEVVDVVDDLVTVRVCGRLRLRRLPQVAPWEET
ncbi:hypothetical protein [Kitasatospora sp. NPDC057223]|uniref:hypothetical protein n=1 Tax=Kitasatospora sp. NPDC057223 TaxID=3346055 RepID=UPI003638CBDA